MDNFLELGRQVIAAQPFSVLLGARLEAFAPGEVTMALTLQAQHTQQDGVAHDGVIGYLAATALIFAGGSALGTPVTVAEYKINFLRPAESGELVARAKAVGTAGQQAVCRCEIQVVTPEAELLVAVAQGTVISRSAAGLG